MKNTQLKYVGFATGGLLLVSLAFSYRSHRKDKKASDFLQLVREMVVPGELGELKKTAFNESYLSELRKEGKRGLLVLTVSKALEHAKKIESSFAWYDDDEDAVYGVFDLLKDHLQVSQVAQAYLTKYQETLLSILQARLSDSEFEVIKKKLQSKRNYRTHGN